MKELRKFNPENANLSLDKMKRIVQNGLDRLNNMITPNFHDCKCSSVSEACGCERDCLYQESLVENGFVIACDCCGHAGHADSDGWIGVVDDQGMCAVFCSENCAGEENYKIWEAAQKDVDGRFAR